MNVYRSLDGHLNPFEHIGVSALYPKMPKLNEKIVAIQKQPTVQKDQSKPNPAMDLNLIKSILDLKNAYQAIKNNKLTNTVIEQKLSDITSKVDIAKDSNNFLTHELLDMVQKSVNNYTMGISYDKFDPGKELNILPNLIQYQIKNAKNILYQYSNFYEQLMSNGIQQINKIIYTKNSSDANKPQKIVESVSQEQRNDISSIIDNIKAYQINVQRANDRFFEIYELTAHIMQKMFRMQASSIQNIK